MRTYQRPAAAEGPIPDRSAAGESSGSSLLPAVIGRAVGNIDHPSDSEYGGTPERIGWMREQIEMIDMDAGFSGQLKMTASRYVPSLQPD